MFFQILRRGTKSHRAIAETAGPEVAVSEVSDADNQVPALLQQILLSVAQAKIHLHQWVTMGEFRY